MVYFRCPCIKIKPLLLHFVFVHWAIQLETFAAFASAEIPEYQCHSQ